jgi:hypothetical protein
VNFAGAAQLQYSSTMATKKKSATKRGSKGKDKVEKVMHEYKRGQLKSGGRKKVSNPKQAIAIGLSEARRAGEDVPPPKRKTASKKKAAKKAPAKKKSATKKRG